MRVDSTASELMSILQKKQARGDDAAGTASSFASVLKNIMAGTVAAQTAPAPATAPDSAAVSATSAARKAKADFYQNLGNTPEINALAEEYALNSAICRSAFMSGDFHRKYERDPAGTMADVRSQKWGEMKTSIWGNMRTNMIVCDTFPKD